MSPLASVAQPGYGLIGVLSYACMSVFGLFTAIHIGVFVTVRSKMHKTGVIPKCAYSSYVAQIVFALIVYALGLW